jgi:uncharacterized protein
VVTGASSGIGAELARELARRGHGVTLAARREDRLNALAEQLGRTHGVRAEVAVLDVADAEARAALRDTLADRRLQVDVLVNNAGFSTSGAVRRADRNREIAMVRTDVEAVADLCTLFLPDMVRRGRGAILNVSSTAAFQPLPGQAGYGACKSFVLSYSQAVRAELQGTGVTLTVLCPGPVKTGFAEVAGFSEEDEASLPKFMWLPAAEVARCAIDGLADGRAVVIPGLANRLAAQVARSAPRRVLLPLLAHRHPSLR